MIKQPLLKYLKPFADYNQQNEITPTTDPDTLYTNVDAFRSKIELIKECHYDIYDQTFDDVKSELFERYMNDDWIYK